MRKLNQWLFVLFLLTLVSCSDKVENKFVVKGKLKNTDAAFVFLEESSPNGQPLIVDSSKIGKDGSFSLSTITKEENLYLLRLPGNPQPVATVINDTEEVTVEADVKNQEKPYTSKGSPATEKLADYFYTSNSKLISIYYMGRALDSMKNAGVPDSILAVESRKKELAAIDFKNDILQILNDSKSPSLSLFVLGSFQSYASNPGFGLAPFNQQQITEMLQKLAERFPDHKGVANLNKSIRTQGTPTSEPAASTLLNKPAPMFALPDVNGTEVSLSSYKGKYVLIDFWASWCRPCREENPNVVNAFNQFKGKNFTILGVSLDREKEAWLKAIKDDQLTWQHVSDLRYWDSMVVPIYGIRGIPYNVLVDPNGVVIAENLRGPQLSQKLAEVLK